MEHSDHEQVELPGQWCPFRGVIREMLCGTDDDSLPPRAACPDCARLAVRHVQPASTRATV